MAEELKFEAGPGFVEGSLVEGLIRALKPEPAFVDALMGIGFNAARIEAKYPDAVWRKILELCAKRLYPTQQYTVAERMLGKRWVAGMKETLVGKVVLGALPMMSAGTLIDRLPRMVSVTSPGMSAAVTEKSDTHRVLKVTVTDLAPAPYFFAGVLESMLGDKKPCTVSVREVLSRSYVLHIAW